MVHFFNTHVLIISTIQTDLSAALRLPEAEIRHTTSAQLARIVRVPARTRERPTDRPSVQIWELGGLEMCLEFSLSGSWGVFAVRTSSEEIVSGLLRSCSLRISEVLTVYKFFYSRSNGRSKNGPNSLKRLVSAVGIEPSTYCQNAKYVKSTVSATSGRSKWAVLGTFRHGCYQVATKCPKTVQLVS